MAFDGVVTKAVVAELNNCLINGKINKIFEPNKNEILLGIYSAGKNYALNISIDSVNYRISLTTNSKPNPQNVLNFCMVLRKHLVGGIIRRIYSNGLERIVFIDIDCYNELNDLITLTLVVELMGKHSNVILLNSNSIVIDSLRHLNKFDNSTRDVFPGSKYINIVSDKLNFADIKTFDEFYRSLDIVANSDFSFSASISKKYNGFGKNNILHLLEFLNIADNTTSTTDFKSIYSYLKLMLNNIENYSLKNISITDSTSLKNISDGANFSKDTSVKSSSSKKDYFVCMNESEKENLSINFFLDDFYYEKEVAEQFKSYRDSVLKLVLNQVGKIKERIKSINLKIKECDKIEMYRLYGELITSNLYRIPDYSQAEITLENYYDSNNLITIPLDNTISPSKNAKNFFKKYRKLQNTIAIVSKQKDLAEAELTYLDSIVYEISEAQNVSDIDNIYSEICDNLIYDKNANTVNNHIYNINSNSSGNTIIKNGRNNIAKFNKNGIEKSIKKQNKENASNMPAKYLVDGYTVFVGKNNKQNDYLTCKLAQNSDIWFHTKDIHGSHVVLKLDKVSEISNKLDINTTTVPDSVLYKCASYAAYYSKARMSQNVPVDYTYIKYVKKPNGAKPGMVIYTNNKTLYVNPQAKV